MKTAFATLAVAATGLVGITTQAEAGPRIPMPPHFGHMPTPGFVLSGELRHQANRHQSHGYRSGGHCSTPRLIRTCEVNRYRQCRTAYTNCGRPYTYHVTVVTYREFYSNGTTRTYTRTFS